MPERVVVTSVGIISALGLGRADHLQALQTSTTDIRYPRHLQTVHAHEFVLGEVDKSNDELSALSGLTANDNGYTRTTLLGLAAMHNLLNGIKGDIITGQPVAFINANTVGGMCTVENMYMDMVAPDVTSGAYEPYIDALDCSDSTRRIAQHFKLKSFVATISTACSSSANAVMLGARMIENGITDRAICGGSDALSKFTLNGFYSLKNVDKQLCKPFDQNRMGLNLGEGAGYLLLESESAAKARGADILAIVSGYANGNDAHHPTSPSPHGEGAIRTMQEALQRAGLQPADISYINAHGTATQNNDQSEGEAIQTVFGEAPYFSSTKPFTGHTLAAAGAIEAIFSIWALQEQMVLPNLNFDTPMEELHIQPVTSFMRNVPVRHVLSNSFGFGGNNVSLVFSKP